MAQASIRTSLARDRAEEPPIVTVYRDRDGIHHARCRRRLDFQGSRGGQEFDFYCYACHEHITLPDHVLTRIVPGALAARA